LQCFEHADTNLCCLAANRTLKAHQEEFNSESVEVASNDIEVAVLATTTLTQEQMPHPHSLEADHLDGTYSGADLNADEEPPFVQVQDSDEESEDHEPARIAAKRKRSLSPAPDADTVVSETELKAMIEAQKTKVAEKKMLWLPKGEPSVLHTSRRSSCSPPQIRNLHQYLGRASGSVVGGGSRPVPGNGLSVVVLLASRTNLGRGWANVFNAAHMSSSALKSFTTTTLQ